MLESDYESEFVMATWLLEKVMGRLDQSCKTTNEEKLTNPLQNEQWAQLPWCASLLMKVRWVDRVSVYVW